MRRNGSIREAAGAEQGWQGQDAVGTAQPWGCWEVEPTQQHVTDTKSGHWSLSDTLRTL